MKIPNEIYEQYKKQGYNKRDIENAYIAAMQEEKHNKFKQQMEGGAEENEFDESQVSNSQFEIGHEEDLIKFQLELNTILERIEHMLRGDLIKLKKGQRYYIKDTSGKFSLLNEYGVQLVMNILTSYINRNTILSNFSKDEVYEMTLNFGSELTDMFYMKYEQMGLDTVQKRQNFAMMITEIVHIVRSSLSRAINGLERTSLREARQVQQHQNITNEFENPSRSKLNPKSWFGSGGGKY